MPPLTFTEAFTFKPLSNHEFETIHFPERMGNALNIAYGGYALAVACKGAYLTVPAGYHLYSMLGNFLGPAFTDRILSISVRQVRQTRTFATRFVEVSQTMDSGERRLCLVALCDFQIQESSLLAYSAPPRMTYTPHSCLPTADIAKAAQVQSGTITQQLSDAHSKNFAPSFRYFDTRHCPEGIFAQNFSGMLKHVPTTQDHLKITEKATAEWVRARHTLEREVDNVVALVFNMDAAIAFAPLSFSHMFVDDVAACSTLEFALRLFSNDIKMEEWHLREMTTANAAEGRTFSEARLWDEGGRMCASMSQQGIMRPKKGEGAKL
ncbi:acyl-CoA thioesterase II [Delitschia confertaspora ATCC 74209]|uniref:Acyl-CoA thioesterase II n=1 Tax=Delitschia confertaspora ATCC 74209 TaxID=1513339 RepID=A0A9P4MP14_9PLEO|nr:acyl-CoA thioesterase II [Delitschia confertaspora ATCC 74209]